MRSLALLVLVPVLALAQARPDDRSARGARDTSKPARAEAVDASASVADAVSELREHASGYVNVKSFGAKGDGIADDGPAIRAAVQAGYDVFFPPGTYRVTSSIDLTFSTGKRLRGASAVASRIVGQVAGYAVVDASGANAVTLENLWIEGAQGPALPSAGVLFYRAKSGVTSGSHRIVGCNVTGHYSIASVVTVSSEGNAYSNSAFQNLEPGGMAFADSSSNVTGVASARVPLAQDPLGGNTVGTATSVTFNCLSTDPRGVCILLDGTPRHGSGPFRHFAFTGCFVTHLRGNFAAVKIVGPVSVLSVHQSSGELYGRYGWYLAPGAILENFSMDGCFWDRGLYGDEGSEIRSSSINAQFGLDRNAPDPPGAFGINVDKLNWSIVHPHALNLKVRTEAIDNIYVGAARNLRSGARIVLPGGASPLSGAVRAALQPDSQAKDLGALRADYNALLEKLRAAGLMDSQERSESKSRRSPGR
jgi:hypothetical protein